MDSLHKQCELLKQEPWLINVIPLMTPDQLDQHLSALPVRPPWVQPEQSPAPVPQQQEAVSSHTVTAAPLLPVPPLPIPSLLEIIKERTSAEAAELLAQLRKEHERQRAPGLALLAAQALYEEQELCRAETEGATLSSESASEETQHKEMFLACPNTKPEKQKT